MMLANLYKKAGQERSSVTSYKEVLRQCPLALDAILGGCLHTVSSAVFNVLSFELHLGLPNCLVFACHTHIL